MRTAVVHNLQRGGAWRRLACQMQYLPGTVIEVCPETADPISAGAIVVPVRLAAPAKPRYLRPPLRYLDQLAIERVWRDVAEVVLARGADVVYANPCQFLQAPGLLLHDVPPALYYCDEPRRVDHEEDGRRSRNPWSAPVYGPLYRRQRRLDRAATARAARVATNSHYTAGEIERAYGRDATVVACGVAEAFLGAAGGDAGPRHFVLSVGALIAAKGHDLVLGTVGQALRRRPVVIVAPRDAPAEAARLEGVAREAGVELEIRTGVSDAELRGLYRTAHATLYLARREPFGLVSLEAQACGCPVLVADEGGLPETILTGVTGWAVARDPVAAAAMLDRLDDHGQRARMSAAAAAHAQRWSWRASAAQIESLLAEVRQLGREPRAGRPAERSRSRAHATTERESNRAASAGSGACEEMNSRW